MVPSPGGERILSLQVGQHPVAVVGAVGREGEGELVIIVTQDPTFLKATVVLNRRDVTTPAMIAVQVNPGSDGDVSFGQPGGEAGALFDRYDVVAIKTQCLAVLAAHPGGGAGVAAARAVVFVAGAVRKGGCTSPLVQAQVQHRIGFLHQSANLGQTEGAVEDAHIVE